MYNVGTTEVLQGYYGCTLGGRWETLVDWRSAKCLWRREIAANRPERRRVPVVGGEYGSDGGAWPTVRGRWRWSVWGGRSSRSRRSYPPYQDKNSRMRPMITASETGWKPNTEGCCLDRATTNRSRPGRNQSNSARSSRLQRHDFRLGFFVLFSRRAVGKGKV
jgi:hypothetical protein